MTPGKDRLLTIIWIWQPWDVGDVAHTAGVVCHWHVQFWSWKIFYASTLISFFFWLVLLDCHDKETLPRQLANVKLQPLSELLVDRPWLFVKTDVSVFNPHIKFSQGLVVNFNYNIRSIQLYFLVSSNSFWVFWKHCFPNLFIQFVIVNVSGV